MDSSANNTAYYELLGLPPGSSVEEVKKAFKKKAMVMHPDKGGDPEAFKTLTYVYEVLSNEQTKQIYDKFGEKGLKDRKKGQGESDYKKAQALNIELAVRLEDVFAGKMVSLKITVKRICGTCKGQGGINLQECPKCKGAKQMRIMIQIAPGIYTPTVLNCDTCKARVNECVKFYLKKGTVISQQDLCGNCNGDRIVDFMKQIDVALEKGVPDGFKYELTGQGHEVPGAHAGDVVAIIKIKEHPQFTRRGADLFMEKKITLREALTGFSFPITHLDGEQLQIGCQAGEVVAPNETLQLPQRGMPFFRSPLNSGNLYVKFTLEFPKLADLGPGAIEQLLEALPGEIERISNSPDTLDMEEFKKTDENPNPEGGQRNEQDIEETQRIQCAQQ